MHPPQIVVSGEYYDSYVYAGRLYLWHLDGSVSTVDWDRLVDGLPIEQRLVPALTIAFRRSQELYADEPASYGTRQVFQRDFPRDLRELSKATMEVSPGALKDATLNRQSYGFPFPHADVACYLYTMYVGSSDGVTAAPLGVHNKHKTIRSVQRLWDGPAFSLSAKYLTLALSAGSEGLYQLLLSDREHPLSPNRAREWQVASDASLMVRWMFESIFSTSYYGDNFLARFDLREKQEKGESVRDRRELKEMIPLTRMVSNQDDPHGIRFAWGVQDRLCYAIDHHLRVVNFNDPTGKDPTFRTSEDIQVAALSGEIVSADSALFGFLIEVLDGLVLVDAFGGTATVSADPVNWRVFPRSKDYTNQLHVVEEGALRVLSYSDVTLENEADKVAGVGRVKGVHDGRE